MVIEHPAIMAHTSILAEARARPAITDRPVSLLAPIEDAYDLIADLERVLKPAAAPNPAPARSKRTATPVY